MVRFLEANGYDVSYFTGVDSDRHGDSDQEPPDCSCRSGTTSTGPAVSGRTSQAARDAGVNLAFFSGNESFWKTRWETSIDGLAHGLPHARLLQGDARQRGHRPRGPADLDRHLARPTVQPARRRRPAGERADRDDLHGQRGAHRRDPGACRPTASCGSGATRAAATLAPGADGDAAHRHARLRVGRRSRQRVPSRRARSTCRRRRSTSHRTCSQDYGSTYGNGTATHHLTLYRAASGALVFGAGTVQWSWGLDATHDRIGDRHADDQHAAGDRQPARRHGRAARDSAVRPHRGHRVHRHRATDVDDHCARRPADSVQAGAP